MVCHYKVDFQKGCQLVDVSDYLGCVTKADASCDCFLFSAPADSAKDCAIERTSLHSICIRTTFVSEDCNSACVAAKRSVSFCFSGSSGVERKGVLS